LKPKADDGHLLIKYAVVFAASPQKVFGSPALRSYAPHSFQNGLIHSFCQTILLWCVRDYFVPFDAYFPAKLIELL